MSNNHISNSRTVTLDYIPDTVLPTQFAEINHGGQRLSQSHRLMLATLADAVNCLRLSRFDKRPSARALYCETREWFFSDDEEWLFSFLNICTVLKYDPGFIRRQIRERYPEQQRLKFSVPCPQRGSDRKPIALHDVTVVSFTAGRVVFRLATGEEIAVARCHIHEDSAILCRVGETGTLVVKGDWGRKQEAIKRATVGYRPNVIRHDREGRIEKEVA